MNNDPNTFSWITIIPWLVAFVSLIFGIAQYLKRRQDAKIKKLAELEAQEEHEKNKKFKHHKTVEEHYLAALEKELGSIRMLGSPDIESVSVKLLDAFVSLDISENLRSENRFSIDRLLLQPEPERDFTPEKVMKRAFPRFRLLLIIGDPGSGKSTLMQYYAVTCLDNDGYKLFGFTEPVLPIFLPLRELEPNNAYPDSLPENLAMWARERVLDISTQDFHEWLHERTTLVLLDGLDEISNLEQRKRVCEWIDNTCTGLKNAYFVVTSRWTGYRKVDGIELKSEHLRADVRDFSPHQQEEFLRKWFRAVYLSQPRDEVEDQGEWVKRHEKLAAKRAQAIIDFLDKEENKSVRQLAAVPMLLQIMAIIWRDREHLPNSRSALYDAALKYLLAYRDIRKKLNPVMPADKAHRVLAPVALWMHETLQKDEVLKHEMHDFMQPILNTLENPPDAHEFCLNLQNRAGLIIEYGQQYYLFRHKSFREYLAGVQLYKDCHKPECIPKLVSNFGNDWWEEPLRFFISEVDDTIFDHFMNLFFRSKFSLELDQKAQNLLQILIKEAAQKKIDSLVSCLFDRQLEDRKKLYILECLKTIGTEEALEYLKTFVERYETDNVNSRRAEDIVAEVGTLRRQVEREKVLSSSDVLQWLRKTDDLFKILPISFRNPFEENAEYLLIINGKYKSPVSKKTIKVDNLYFAKYPVTNRRFRQFINYLKGDEIYIEKKLPLTFFADRLIKFALNRKDYFDYLERDHEKWSFRLRSRYDDDKRLNGDDQPVVGITWYAARSYCFWLSILEAAWKCNEDVQKITNIPILYRLPFEDEWFWAAAGREQNKYPWPQEKGHLSPKLANYNENVGATTPVGRYPDGATTAGLMDMGGNVWEWMEDNFGEKNIARALRGGSWGSSEGNLRCTSRIIGNPSYRLTDDGFRVIRSR